MRLLLDEDGGVSVTSTAQPVPATDVVMRYVISDTRINSADLFLYHKTTRREVYDREWKHYSDTLGADEVIYLNETGELAEGSRTTIFVERGGKPRDTAALRRLSSRHAQSRTDRSRTRIEEGRLTVDYLNKAGSDFSRKFSARPCAGRAARSPSGGRRRAPGLTDPRPASCVTGLNILMVADFLSCAAIAIANRAASVNTTAVRMAFEECRARRAKV